MTTDRKWSVAELYSALDYLDQPGGVFFDYVNGAKAAKLEAVLGNKVAVCHTEIAVEQDYYLVYVASRDAADEAVAAGLFDADPLEMNKGRAFDLVRQMGLDWVVG
jgi:hypothetical protein